MLIVCTDGVHDNLDPEHLGLDSYFLESFDDLNMNIFNFFLCDFY